MSSSSSRSESILRKSGVASKISPSLISISLNGSTSFSVKIVVVIFSFVLNKRPLSVFSDPNKRPLSTRGGGLANQARALIEKRLFRGGAYLGRGG